MEKKFNIQPHQDWSVPQDVHLQQVVDHEDRQLLRELERMQQNRMRHFAELIDSCPKLRAMCSFRGSTKFDLSALEERVEHLPLHTLFAQKGPEVTTVTGRVRNQNMSDRLIHGGIVRGPVHRHTRMSDNLPKGEIMIDPSKIVRGSENMRLHHDTMQGDDWFRAMALGLMGEPVGGNVMQIDSILDKDVIVDFKTTGDPKGPQAQGRALRIERNSDWPAERRDRAATSAPVRKKLRTKTRAQKKARRKQR